MFLNIIVSIGCAFVIFHSYEPTRATLAGTKEGKKYDNIMFRNNLRTFQAKILK